MHIKHHRQKASLRSALRGIATTLPVQELTQPLVHINCRGTVQIENCSRVLEYDQESIRLLTCGNTVAVKGEGLTICMLNAHITEIRGRIFRLDFFEEEQ